MKSFFDLKDTLNEAIDSLSPQAMGRKREMMLRALTLDDAEFERWVHDRIIRFAEQNGIPLQQLDSGTFKKGFAEWQQHLQQNDRSYDQYKQQIGEYVTKFMTIAPSIIARFQSGETSPVREPMSPTMVPFEADGKGRKRSKEELEAQAQEPTEMQYAKHEEPFTPEQIQSTQRGAMNIVDLVTNSVTNMGENENRINKAQFKRVVRELADEIAQANGVDTSQLNYDMIDDYLSSIRSTLETENISGEDALFDDDDINTWENLIKQELIDQYGIMEPQEEKELRAKQQAEQRMLKAAMDPSTPKNISGENMELGIVAAIENISGQKHLSDVSRNKINSKLSDEEKMYFDIQAQSLMEKYPFLKGAKFSHIGRKSGKLTPEWQKYNDAGAAKTSKSDVSAHMSVTLADNNFVRYDEEQNTFVRCSMSEVQDASTGCTSKLLFSVKKGETQLMSARQAETIATFETALSNLSELGHDFTNPQKLSEYFMNNYELDEGQAQERANTVVKSVDSIKALTQKFIVGLTAKGQVNMYKSGAFRDNQDPAVRKTQEVIDAAQLFIDSVNKEMNTLVENMPEIISEMAYIAASGDGKFVPDSVASHFLSFSETDPASGPKIVPITRKFMYNLVANGGIKVQSTFKSDSIKRIKTKLKQDFKTKGIQAGLEGKQLDDYVKKNVDKESPYSFSTVLRLTMDELPDTPMMENLNYFQISSLLEAQDKDVYNNTQGISDTTKKYTQEALKWAFSNPENLMKFFEIVPSIGDVDLPDFGDDVQGTYFKKELMDELRDLDML
jgi:hypothetical protein